MIKTAESFVKVLAANKNKTRPNLRVTIPQEVEDLLDIKKGDKLFVFTEGNNRVVYQKTKGK